MTTATAAQPKTGLVRGISGTVAAIIVAVAADAAIAAVSHAAGVSDNFTPLEFASFTSLTVIGVLIAAIVWSRIRSKAARPRTVLRMLVPVVVLLSLVPDLILGFGKLEPHTTWGGVAALVLMHLAVSAAAVTAFALGMPASDQTPT